MALVYKQETAILYSAMCLELNKHSTLPVQIKVLKLCSASHDPKKKPKSSFTFFGKLFTLITISRISTLYRVSATEEGLRTVKRYHVFTLLSQFICHCQYQVIPQVFLIHIITQDETVTTKSIDWEI